MGRKPRVVVAFATRPGANFADPSGIKKLADKVESLKAQSLIPLYCEYGNQVVSRRRACRDDRPNLRSFPSSIAARRQVSHVSSTLAILGKVGTFAQSGE